MGTSSAEQPRVLFYARVSSEMIDLLDDETEMYSVIDKRGNNVSVAFSTDPQTRLALR